MPALARYSHLRLLTLGLAAGDSLGSTSEFLEQSSVPHQHDAFAAGWPFAQVGGGHFGWLPGWPTDDTDMAMCLLRSHFRHGEFNGEGLAREFVAWLNSRPKDIGSATFRGLSAVRDGTPWHEGGLAEYRRNHQSAANGSLMRNGVVAGLASSLDEALEIALQQSLPTHYAPLPVFCCLAQTYALWETLAGRQLLAGNWLQSFNAHALNFISNSRHPVVVEWVNHTVDDQLSAWEEMFDVDFDPDSFNPYTEDYTGCSGYCLLTLQIGIWAAHWASRNTAFPAPRNFPPDIFSRATGSSFLAAVAVIGEDADTYGAVAGPLIAAVTGEVPVCFTDRLRILPELERLLPS